MVYLNPDLCDSLMAYGSPAFHPLLKIAHTSVLTYMNAVGKSFFSMIPICAKVNVYDEHHLHQLHLSS